MSSVLCNQSITGTLGVGTTAPSHGIKVIATDSAAKIYHNSSFTAARYSVLQIGMMTSGTIADGFGGNLIFRTGGNGFDGYQAASIGTERNGHDGTHDLIFATSTTGSSSDKMIIKNDGKVGINTDAPSTQLHVVGTSRFGGSSDYIELTSAGNIKLNDTTAGIVPVTNGTQTLSIGATMTGNWDTIRHYFDNEVVWNPGVLGGADDMNLDTSGNLSIGGDLTVGGGDITLSGTGRIQGVDTVSASTDAANKAYVDAHGISSISVGTGLDITAGSTPTITLDTTEMTAIDGDDPSVVDIIVNDGDGGQPSRISLANFIANTLPKQQTIIHSNFDDATNTTSYQNIPFNYIFESSTASYYHTFACPSAGKVKRITFMHIQGSMTIGQGGSTTQLRVIKNNSTADTSGELLADNGSSDGSKIVYEPNTTFANGDFLRFQFSRSSSSLYWRGVTVSIVLEFTGL